MAQRGTPLPQFVIARLRQLRERGESVSACARLCGVSRETARKYLGLQRRPADLQFRQDAA